MNLRTVALLATFGMVVTSAGALAIPRPAATGPGTEEPKPDSPGAAPSHFTAGQTLALDGRLGHASLAQGERGETYLFASVTGADSPGVASAPLNLGIVVDRSGSMKGERIANAIDAATGIVERMRDGDSVTVVAFDSTVQVIVPPSRTTPSSRGSIEAAIRSIRLGGDTCISCGLEEAMSQLQVTSLSGDQVTRMILLSDGEANHGIKDVPGLRALASRMRDRGCSISTIGVDVEFDEKIMAAIASESNGRHYFVANASGLPAIFEEEFDSLLATVARDGELSVDLAPGVEVEQVFDRAFRREGSRVVVPFGTFSAKQEKTVLMKLRVPTDREGTEPVADVSLAYRDLLARRDASSEGQLALLVTDP
jgi:Ca-activated chloride channel family protein